MLLIYLIVNYLYRKYGVPLHNFSENWTSGISHLKWFRWFWFAENDRPRTFALLKYFLCDIFACFPCCIAREAHTNKIKHDIPQEYWVHSDTFDVKNMCRRVSLQSWYSYNHAITSWTVGRTSWEWTFFPNLSQYFATRFQISFQRNMSHISGQ